MSYHAKTDGISLRELKALEELFAKELLWRPEMGRKGYCKSRQSCGWHDVEADTYHGTYEFYFIHWPYEVKGDFDRIGEETYKGMLEINLDYDNQIQILDNLQSSSPTVEKIIKKEIRTQLTRALKEVKTKLVRALNARIGKSENF